MHTTFLVILGLYLVATLFYLLRLVTHKLVLSAVAFRILIAACLVQAATLGLHFYQHPGPYFINALEQFQVASFILALGFINLCLFKKFFTAGPFVIVLIDIFCVLSLVLENPYSIATTQPGSAYLFLHLASVFLSLPVFSVGLVSAVMYLISERALKQKHVSGLVERFPPLEVLDQIHYRAIFSGFLLFTFAMIAGTGYAKITTGHYLKSDLKQLASVISWMIFAIALNFRVEQGLEGHKGILISIFGVLGLALSFFLGLA
jgi:ABC-type uncharacterized transport system permease subunit